VVTDWKTGKFREDQNEDYLEQLELYALSALILYPHIQKVKPRLVYLDIGIIHPTADVELVFTRADLPKLKKLWVKRTKAMLSDKLFAPRPNDKCKWCFFRSSNKAAGGGQCKF
jgi:CRISPR/Cas system-associated exonuclease Cas4 (RecB family)